MWTGITCNKISCYMRGSSYRWLVFENAKIFRSYVKACVRYFLTNFYFSPNGSPWKTMRDVFYFIQNALSVSRDIQVFVFPFSPYFLSVTHCSRTWSEINLKVYDLIDCLNKNLMTHFIWYLEKEKSYDIETLSIDRVLHKEHFYEKIMQKIWIKN